MATENRWGWAATTGLPNQSQRDVHVALGKPFCTCSWSRGRHRSDHRTRGLRGFPTWDFQSKPGKVQGYCDQLVTLLGTMGETGGRTDGDQP